MSYLKFDKTLMANLDESIQRESIHTNRNGAYSSSTIVGCNTRKCHGLMVLPCPSLGKESHVLLSSLDVSIVQHGAEFNLAVHQHQSGVVSPNGHKYIRQYNIDSLPTTIYRVGGVILRKEQSFCHFEHRIIIRYTLLDAHSDTLLRFKPFLAFRSIFHASKENAYIDTNRQAVEHGFGMRLYDGYPMLYMQFDKAPQFDAKGYWYKDLLYKMDRERGDESVEDLYVPGTFELSIKKGESIYFSAAIEPIETKHLKELFEKERDDRIERVDFISCLKNAAQQLYYRPTPHEGYLMAGYPWLGVRARDQLIALPGCTLYADMPMRFDRVMNTLIPYLRNYMQQLEFHRIVSQVSDPDIGLWTIWVLQQYATLHGLDSARERFGSFIQEIVRYYMSNRHPQLRLRDNGLLYMKGCGRAHSWMNAELEGRALLDRQGYLVEHNALWYNALCFLRELNEPDFGAEQLRLISRIESSFAEVFLNEYGYLFDHVCDDKELDWSVRPNMLFAISLPYSALSRSDQRSVLDVITRELLTPKGLRTLSPKSEGYYPYSGERHEDRAKAFFNGSIWPWLLGSYADAYLKIYGNAGVSFLERALMGMEEEMHLHGIGTISEVYDGNPPFKNHGAISFAMSVGEILRARAILTNYQSRLQQKPIYTYTYTNMEAKR